MTPDPAPPEDPPDAGPAPLAGVRVLDLSRMLAGPVATAMLADAGAEVIKVEAPGRGDDMRQVAPFHKGESALFLLVNRGKKSLTLDLKSPKGVEILHRLAARSDIVVENFKPGVAARLGADYATLAAVNPRLVYVSISGFGQEGPFADRPAYDIIAQAMGGLMSVTGAADGPPTRAGESFGDLCAALYASWSAVVALHARERTGRGQHLDVAMVDSIFSLMVTGLSQYLYAGRTPARLGNRHPLSTPYDAFPAADGHVVIAVANDRLFRRLAEAMDRPDLADDPRFGSDSLRTENEAALRPLIEAWTRDRPVSRIVETLERAGVPAGPIWSVGEVLESAHGAARDLVARVEHGELGRLPLVPQPVRFAGSGKGAAAPPPRLGEHTDWVLGRLLGLDADEIAALRAAGVV